jgi:hypothetical protein
MQWCQMFNNYKTTKVFSYFKMGKFQELVSLNVMKMGAYSQHFILFVTPEWTK